MLILRRSGLELFSPDITFRLKANTSPSAGLILGTRGAARGGNQRERSRPELAAAAPRRAGERAWAPDAMRVRNSGSGSHPAGGGGGGAGTPACRGRARRPVAPLPPPAPPAHRCPAWPAAAGATGSASRPCPLPPATWQVVLFLVTDDRVTWRDPALHRVRAPPHAAVPEGCWN